MPSANPTTLARRLRDWAEKPENRRFLRTAQEQQIERALAAPGQVSLHAALWLLGTWWLGTGQARVLGGESVGFDDARIGCSFLRCSLRLRSGDARQPRHRATPAFAPLHGAQACTLALALDDPHAEELFETFRTLPDASFGPDDAFALFVRELLNLRAAARPAVTPRLGPWFEVLLHWQGDRTVFARHLAGILDHHLERTGRGEEFGDPPLWLYPAEVLAVRNVRTLLGLPTPRVEQVLMFGNLGQMAPQGPWPRDPLLDRIEALL